MNKNHIIIIILLIIIFALIGGIFFISNAPDKPVIYNNTIPGVGTFNTTNVTNFTLSSSSKWSTNRLFSKWQYFSNNYK